MILRIASFDIGIKNFAIYVEDFDASQLVKIGNVSDIPQNENKRDMQNIRDICLNGKRIYLHNYNLDNDGKEINNEMWYRNMIKILVSLDKIWKCTKIFIIEHQVIFNRVQIQLLAQVCYTFFLTRFYGENRAVLYYNNKNKTKFLACPNDVDIKKWSPRIAISSLKNRGDIEGAKIIEDASKKDDLGDAFCQAQSIKYRFLTKKGIFTKRRSTIKKHKKKH